MNDYVTTLPFDEVGLLNDGLEVGVGFSGDAHLDEDGNVVGLSFDTYSNGRPAKNFYIDVPPRKATGLSFWQEVASRVADWLENSCKAEIQRELIDWREAQGYREYEYQDREIA